MVGKYFEGTALPLGGNNANNAFDSSTVVANRDGSMLERLEALLGSGGDWNPRLGYRVNKVENVNTATGVDLFTVTGKVLVSAWFGEVTNALHTTVTDYKLRVKTDNVDLCAATDISSAAIGWMFSLSGDAGLTLLTGSSHAVSAVKTQDNNAIGLADRLVGLASGSCVLQSLRTAGASGDSITHSLWYWPLEASASVAAA